MFTDRKHFKCLLWKGLWGLSALSFVLAAASVLQGAGIWLGATHWAWSAVTLGVLAVSIKLDCHDCSVCASAGK